MCIRDRQKIEQARAEAESYKLKNQEITKETLAMEWINKWNGELPKVSGDTNALLDIGALLNEESESTGE